MKEIIRTLDDLMDNIISDISRSKFVEYLQQLKELSRFYAEAKQLQSRLKTDRDLLEPILKDEIRKQFEIEQTILEDNFMREQFERQELWEKVKITVYKREKMTIDELDMRMKLDQKYRSNMMMRWEQDELVSYLEPLIRAYYERANWIKFQDNLNKQYDYNKDFNN